MKLLTAICAVFAITAFFAVNTQAATVQENIDVLSKYYGETLTYRTKSPNVTATLLHYLHERYDDERLVEDATIVVDSHHWEYGKNIVGTFSITIALKTLMHDISFNHPGKTNHELDMIERKVTTAMHDLKKQGIVFGFDGNGMNGCATVTPILLLLDKQAGRVTSVELEPCYQ